ncbi:MAG TPA: DUF5686 family protein [Bacteroidales bacterium]|nr:DUF5686 family protein [Bacteroidales bacterium]
MGTVIDATTKDPIPFVNIYFAGTGVQTVTDFDGKFSIETKLAKDSLTAQYMGYVTKKKPVIKNRFQYVDFELAPASFELREAVILPGENPAEILLKKVINNKEKNNREFFDYFQYEAYTKVQIDANNYSEKLQNNILLRPFKFVFESSDTSVINGKVYLPVFFSESMSDIYFRKDPKKYREIMKASRFSGMENKTLTQFLGDTYIKMNIYDNYNELFEKNFVSPIANFGLSYYKYYLVDSGYIGNRWCYHLMFKPRRSQELTYTGNLWIHDTTYGVVKVDMKVVKDANINIINEILFDQEFTLVDNQYWMPVKDFMIADLNLTENSSNIIGIYLHKNTTYNNFLINQPKDPKFYNNPEAIVVSDSAVDKKEEDWEKIRPVELTKDEKKIYALVDTVKSLQAFKLYKGIGEAILGNYIHMGILDIGPLLQMFSMNQVEGQRYRLGFRTSTKFSRKFQLMLHGAYGTADDAFKFGGTAYYMFSRNPHTILGVSYKYDIEQLGQSSNAFSEDYILRGLLSRNKSEKLTMAKDLYFFFEKDWFMGFYNDLFLRYRVLYPLKGESAFKFVEGNNITTKNVITISEVQLITHFAYNEKFIAGAFRRTSIGTKYPIIDLTYSYGIKNCFNSDYEFHKLDLRVRQWFNIGTVGWSRYMVSAGKVWGTLPFQLLKIHEGNETYMWDEYAFNTMNYYEFVSDAYFSWYYTHHFDGFFLNRIPLIKKLRWREVVYFKGLVGSITSKNKDYNIFPENVYFLNKGPYSEAGVAIENIFKFMRIDGVWRLNYLDHPRTNKFIVMVSFRFNF